ncbi:hypothetical protein LINGRAHAP2_LOCUS24276 [Linum grandiflorum]
MENDAAASLILIPKAKLSNHVETAADGGEAIEFKSLRLCLNLLCLNDHSNIWAASLSWSVFFILAFGVPTVSHFLFLCADCDQQHQRPYDAVVQFSLSVCAVISFLCLSHWSRKYGFRRFLFLDKLDAESLRIRRGYQQELKRSMALLCTFVLPCFAVESAYRIWWYATGAFEIPYFENMYASDAIFCILQLASWVYRISIFILVCILYRLICHLQILRLQEFADLFQSETEVGSILKEHLRTRRNLRIISHRFRRFILLSLLLVTASQLMCLLVTTRSTATNNIYEAGELTQLCSINLVIGLFICLRSATKITHKAQAITSLAAKWHVCATINSSYDHDIGEGETPTSRPIGDNNQVHPINIEWVLDEEDEEEEEEEDGDSNSSNMVPIFARTISFQRRQALVTYLENNKAGMTVFGFMMDRTWLHTIFGVELALLLWLLNKTIVSWT